MYYLSGEVPTFNDVPLPTSFTVCGVQARRACGACCMLWCIGLKACCYYVSRCPRSVTVPPHLTTLHHATLHRATLHHATLHCATLHHARHAAPQEHEGRVTGLVLLKNSLLASISFDRTIRIWDLTNMKPVSVVANAHETPLQCIEYAQVGAAVRSHCLAT